MVLTPMAGIALFSLAAVAVSAVHCLFDRVASRRLADAVWFAAAMVLVLAASVGCAAHYLPRHRLLFGHKYDSVMIDDR
jgi:D-galactosaminyltransferase